MDPVADMLTAILNAQRVGKKRLATPYSVFKKSLLEFLQAKKYIGSVRLQEGPKAQLIVSLAYDENEKPAILGVRRYSKPGSRYYVSAQEIPYTYKGVGMIILSTSSGLMDDKQARKQSVGGELICAIW